VLVKETGRVWKSLNFSIGREKNSPRETVEVILFTGIGFQLRVIFFGVF